MDAPRFRRLKQEFQALLEAAPEQRAVALARLAEEDAALAAELAGWLSAEERRAGDWLERPAVLGDEDDGVDAGGPPAPERVGPWLLEAEIGRGGMGSVFRGRRDDGAFEQTVAVKLVRSELASEALRRRFVAERRILAGLVHPNIAHLIDGGATADGTPYLVLEHVAGEPIDRYSDRHELSVDERLRLFVVVCGAVAFAHQNLVLHRDLKAGNVLVDESGRAKLLDFGIAKLLVPSAEEEDWTALGMPRPLTPEWASPEQLRGAPLTTASDVYSLGVLLHVLLTGKRPHRFDGGVQGPEAFADAIERDGPPPLAGRHLVPPPGVDPRRLRGDLQRIVARALAPAVDRRYGSVVELVADVERYLGGLPVSAHPPSLGYRLAKLVRRHRAAAAAMAVAAASLLAATAVSLRQARIAEVERARAERRFDDVRRLANVVLFDVHRSLENATGAMAARRLLVDTALRYLDDLAREAGSEPALLRELAAGYERIGEVQGMPEWSSEGRTGDALASFERALELERRSRVPSGARGTMPTPGAEHTAEARLLTRIGSILAARGETGAALVRHREARDLLARRLAASPSTEVRLELAQAQVAVGDDVWELGDVPASVPHYRDALDTARAAVAADPASTLAARQVGVVEQRLGDAAADAGDWPRAIEHHAASLAVDRELAARSPGDIEIRRDLGTDLSRLGVDEAARGSAAAALEFHRQAGSLRQALLAEEPKDARAADDLAETHLQTAEALAALGQDAEASREIEHAVRLRRSLSARDPRNARWRDSLATALATRAELESRLGRAREAMATRAEALSIRRQLRQDSPDFAGNLEPLAALEKQVGGGSAPTPGGSSN